MKAITALPFFIAYFHLISAFLKVNDFFMSDLPKCYDQSNLGTRRVSLNNVNGQELPLPNSVETFISLVEQYETLKPETNTRDLVSKLLRSFRIDNLYSDLRERKLRDNNLVQHEDIKRALCSVVTNGYQYLFNEEDFTNDEKCALHFMLSHTVNDTRIDEPGATFNENKSKFPREIGVASVHSQWKHAFAFGRVLLGIYTALAPEEKEVDVNDILRTLRVPPLAQSVKINKVYAVTVGDLVITLMDSEKKELLPNGVWNDISCPTEYRLEDNNNALISYSELRGAVDGLIIGTRIQNDRINYEKYKLSQILRMYYGYYGLLDNERSRWCSREKNFNNLPELQGQMLSFNILYKAFIGGSPSDIADQKISEAISLIKTNIFNNMDAPECSITDLSLDRKYTSPTSVFVILDMNAAKMNLQAEIIGNLSRDFDLRPHGNLMGVYTNWKPPQQNQLDTVVKNTGIAGCPSCFAKYYSRSGSKEDDAEIWKDLNYTLTKYEEEREDLQEKIQEPKAGSPGKVVLYFKFGSPNYDWRLENAVHEFKWFFRGTTVLSVGDNKEQLKNFVENEDKDIFTGINPEQIAKSIKERLNKIPGEYLFKRCDQSTSATEADNKQEYYISPNKIQYWAMYPQYFQKSLHIKMRFNPEEGTQIKVCFVRDYAALLENRYYVQCKDSATEEIIFYVSNPCNKKNILTCEPFFFSVEAKKQNPQECTSLRCSTPKDIQFQFSHEGISCNVASYVSISSLALIFAAVMLYMQRQ